MFKLAKAMRKTMSSSSRSVPPPRDMYPGSGVQSRSSLSSVSLSAAATSFSAFATPAEHPETARSADLVTTW